MLKWMDVIKFATREQPEPPRKVIKSEEEWKEILPEDVFYVTRKKGTERPHSSDMCTSFEPGIYACACCGQVLFDSTSKFDSGTGWPSFTQPLDKNAVAYHKDYSFGMTRVEALCNVCDAHLGHVFQDGPPPGGLRYCINALALKKVKQNIQKIVLGGGCFWCTEAVFQRIKGVLSVKSGYAGGHVSRPVYQEVVSGMTGHAEVVEVTYDADIISLYQILMIHMTTHDPTTLNQQGADKGTQYRSVIYFRNDNEKDIIDKVLAEAQTGYHNPIVTEVKQNIPFFEAEEYHQNYYNLHLNQNPYCSFVISPKIKKLQESWKDLLKARRHRNQNNAP